MKAQSLSRRRAGELRTLSRKKYREKHGQFIVEGRRALDAAIEADAPLIEVLVSDDAGRDARVTDLVDRISADVLQCSESVFRDISQVETAQGILGVVETQFLPFRALADCQTIVALDGVQDPGNAGTLLRTAGWFGVGGVIAGPGTVDLVNPKVVRAAMGAHWHLKLATADRLDDVIDALVRGGITPYAADLGGTPVGQWEPDMPAMLVLGSEAHGVSAPVHERVHERVYVDRPGQPADPPGGVESLNVAMASGIVMYHWFK